MLTTIVRRRPKTWLSNILRNIVNITSRTKVAKSGNVPRNVARSPCYDYEASRRETDQQSVISFDLVQVDVKKVVDSI